MAAARADEQHARGAGVGMVIENLVLAGAGPCLSINAAGSGFPRLPAAVRGREGASGDEGCCRRPEPVRRRLRLHPAGPVLCARHDPVGRCVVSAAVVGRRARVPVGHDPPARGRNRLRLAAAERVRADAAVRSWSVAAQWLRTGARRRGGRVVVATGPCARRVDRAAAGGRRRRAGADRRPFGAVAEMTGIERDARGPIRPCRSSHPRWT